MNKNSPDDFMRAAVAEARRGVLKGDGGPFGAVVVKDGAIAVFELWRRKKNRIHY
jgi:tRNA(Arg) A34 adenosine deaminase TadA